MCPALPDHPLLAMSDPANIKAGFMFACRVEDAAAALPELPELPALELLQ